MPDTNPDAVKLLSDDALREIDELQVARKRLLKQGKEFHLETAVWNIDTLCATVRALRAEIRGIRRGFPEWAAEWDDLKRTLRESEDTNTALREQLAQSRAENERLASQLKQWQEEKDTKAGYL